MVQQVPVYVGEMYMYGTVIKRQQSNEGISCSQLQV